MLRFFVLTELAQNRDALTPGQYPAIVFLYDILGIWALVSATESAIDLYTVLITVRYLQGEHRRR